MQSGNRSNRFQNVLGSLMREAGVLGVVLAVEGEGLRLAAEGMALIGAEVWTLMSQTLGSRARAGVTGEGHLTDQCLGGMIQDRTHLFVQGAFGIDWRGLGTILVHLLKWKPHRLE